MYAFPACGSGHRRRRARVCDPGVCRSRHHARELRLRVRLRAAGLSGERDGGYAESLLRLEHAARAAVRDDDRVAGLRLRVDRRLLALERLRVDVGQRPLGAPAGGLRLRAAVLRLRRRQLRLHAWLLVASGSRTERLAGSRSPRRPSRGLQPAAGLAHASAAGRSPAPGRRNDEPADDGLSAAGPPGHPAQPPRDRTDDGLEIVDCEIELGEHVGQLPGRGALVRMGVPTVH